MSDSQPNHPARSSSLPISGMSTLLVLLLSDRARAPVRATIASAGYDLFAAESRIIPPGQLRLVATDLSLVLPIGTYARIAPRSGLAAKHNIDIGGGVVDPDYTGAVGIIVFNFGKNPFHVHQGQRIAQLILEKIAFAPLRVVGSLGTSDSVHISKRFEDERALRLACTHWEGLGAAERGESGFGSTGILDPPISLATRHCDVLSTPTLVDELPTYIELQPVVSPVLPI